MSPRRYQRGTGLYTHDIVVQKLDTVYIDMFSTLIRYDRTSLSYKGKKMSVGRSGLLAHLSRRLTR